MNGRKWRVCYDVADTTLSCAGSNYHHFTEKYICEIRMVPTVGNVRSFIESRFPAETIETTWSSLAEQIRGDGNLAMGFFSVSLKSHSNEEFTSRSISFMEV